MMIGFLLQASKLRAMSCGSWPRRPQTIGLKDSVRILEPVRLGGC